MFTCWKMKMPFYLPLVIIFLIAFFLDLNVIDTNLLLSGDVKFNEVVIKIQLLNHAFYILKFPFIH